jgi:predicted amidohydrolase
MAAMAEAAAEKADFLATPEGSLSGYTSHFDQPSLESALHELLALAKNLNLGLFLGTCFKDADASCRNQVRIYAPDGSFIGAHSKILVCSPIHEPGTGEMLEYSSAPLQVFAWQGLKIGALVCNDLWASPGHTTLPNPYLAWKLRQMGAQFIVHVINSGANPDYLKFHESSAELWAQNLQIPIFEVNAAQGSSSVNARSGLIDSKGLRPQPVPASDEHLFYADVNLATSHS